MLCGLSFSYAAPTTLTVVMDDNYPPYIQRRADGSLDGYLVDAWQLWSRKTGVKVELRATDWAQAQALMAAGKADVIDTIFDTPARRNSLDFSPPYAQIPVAIFTDSSIAGIHDLQSLQGFLVAAKSGDACVNQLTAAGIANVDTYPSYNALVEAAINKKVRVFCMDEPPATYLILAARQAENFHKAFELYRGDFHRAVHKGDTATLALVERGFAAFTPIEQHALQRKWMGSEISQHPYTQLLRNVLMGLFGLLLVVVAWTWQLRRKVAQKTRALLESQREISASHARLELLLNSMSEGAYGVDTQGLCTFVNPAFLSILGYQRAEQVLGKHIHELIHYAHADGSKYPASECKMYQAYVDQRAIHEAHEVFWHKDGHAIPIELWSCPMLVDGKVVGAVATFLDISERLKTSELIRKNVEQLQFIFASSPIAVRIVGFTQQVFGEVLLANQRYADMLNVPVAEVYGRRVSQYYAHSEDERDIVSVLAAGQSVTGRLVELRIPEQSPVWTLASYLCMEFEGQPAVLAWFYDVTELKSAEAKVQRMAFYDPLTDLPNRRLLEERASLALLSSKRSGRYGALLFLDLDNFKPLNDTHGHALGDLLLIEVAQRLKNCVREIDTVARFGGDEFVVMLVELDANREASLTQARGVAEKIRAALAQPYCLTPPTQGQAISSIEHHCTASIGLSVFSYQEVGAIAVVLKCADEAMYQAKAAGRNQIYLCQLPNS